MTPRRTIAILFAAVLLAAGCSKEEYYEFCIEASADDFGTRTSYENEKTFSWTRGDRISVLFNNGSTDRFFTFTAQSAGASSKFTGSVTRGYSPGAADGNKWALYPAAEHVYSNGTISFRQPAEVDFTSDGFSANIPMAAEGDASDNYVFKPICSVVKFSFSGIQAATVDFKVSATNGRSLSGLFPCEAGGYNLRWRVVKVNEGPELSISFKENTNNGKAWFYVPIPAFDAVKFIPKITLSDSSDGTVLYTATAKKGLPETASANMGRIIVMPEINLSESPAGEKVHCTYTESTGSILNPERGFYKGSEYWSASSTPLKESKLTATRTEGRSLFLLEYYLKDFIESDISDAYLTLIENNFKALRSGGVKCILRFAYKDGHADSDKPWDATEAWVMRHIEQLKPLLQEYKDVIYVLQAGFIGSWGEWYYTTNFGMSPSSAADYAPRKRVLTALLDAMPADRQIEVRTPAFKMKIMGLGLADTLSRSTAHNGSDKARVAGHNDCFGASGSDSGTFKSDTERAFWAADTRYTIMGGETCAVSDWCHCNAYGSAAGTLSDLATYHWSYLHLGYHQDVINRWKTEGCYDEIDKRLGYRIVMQDADFRVQGAGKPMNVTLHLQNKGYAAPMNPRGAYLVLTGSSGAELERWELGADPRFWLPEDGLITIEKTVSLPAGASGTLKLHLWLPDPEPALNSDSRFAIRLANDDMWDSNTGYNLLYTFKL